eukprot:gene9782-10816_t
MRKRSREDESFLPSHEEQKQLHNIDVLMKSNLHHLQTTELLAQIDATKKMNKKSFLDWLGELQECLKDREGKTSFHDREVTGAWMEKLSLPGLSLCNRAEDIAITFQCPSSVEIVGSLATETVVAPLLTVDLALPMSASFFNPRDILNHRYFDKRRLFLAAIFKTIQLRNKRTGDSFCGSLSICYLKGDHRKPIIELQPAFSDIYRVRLIPVMAQDVFKVVQLRLAKNNVRPADWEEIFAKGDSSKGGLSLTPTPCYNQAILEDMAILLQQKVLERVVGGHHQAVQLFKIWLTQRGFSLQAHGLDGHQASLFVAFLALHGKLQEGMPPLNAFSAILAFIAETDFTSKVLDLSNGRLLQRRQVVHGSCALVLCHPMHGHQQQDSAEDLQVYLNTTWRLSAGSLQALQNEARHSLHLLGGSVRVQNAPRNDAFELLFIRKRGIFERNDVVFHLPLPSWSQLLASYSVRESQTEEDKELLQLYLKEAEEASLHMLVWDYVAEKSQHLFSVALSGRLAEDQVEVSVSFAHPSLTASSELIDHNHPKPSPRNEDFEGYIIVGFVLSPEKAIRRVEKGPAVSAPDDGAAGAAEKDGNTLKGSENTFFWRGLFTAQNIKQDVRAFQLFYGSSKCGVRRFKSGEIVHAVVWESSEGRGGGLIVDEIFHHTLYRHFPEISEEECGGKIKLVNTQLEQVAAKLASGIRDTNQVEEEKVSLDPVTKSQLAFQVAFDDLKKVLLKVKGLPLTFEGIYLCDPRARYTSLHPAIPHPLLLIAQGLTNAHSLVKEHMGQTVDLLQVSINLRAVCEQSSRWPTTGTAIQQCKVALLLHLRRALLEQCQITSFMIEQEEPGLFIPFQGYLFRLLPFAHVDVERQLLKELAAARSTEEDEEELFEEENVEKEALRLVSLPSLHHNKVKALAAAFPLFPKVVKAFLVWRDLHFFSNHLGQEAIELLVAQDFLQPVTMHPPSTVFSGLMRSLQRFATFNWDEEPFIVDFSTKQDESVGEGIGAGDRATILMRFRAMRQTYQSLIESGQLLHPKSPYFPSIYLVSSCDRLVGFEPDRKFLLPERVVLKIMIAAAQASLRRLKTYQEQSGVSSGEVEKALTSEAVLKKCDVVLSFHDGLCRTRVEIFANTPAKDLTLQRLIIRSDGPVASALQWEVLQSLEQQFGNVAVFFFDALRGKRLGILLRPSYANGQTFNVLQSKFRRLEEESQKEKDLLFANKEELLQAILLQAGGVLQASK